MLEFILNLDVFLRLVILTISFIGIIALIIKKRFLSEINFFGPKSSKIEDVLEWLFLWSGFITLLFGFIGVILVVFLGEKLAGGEILNFVFTFFSFYMLAFGLFLIASHKKIFIRPKIRR